MILNLAILTFLAIKFISRNSLFFLLRIERFGVASYEIRIARFKLAIVSYEVQIARYELAILKEKKSEL